MRVALRFLGKGFGGCHEQIELLFRQESYVGQVVLFDEPEGQRTERFRFPDAQRQQEIVLSARVIPRHGRSS
jgi:hypothetical protein